MQSNFMLLFPCDSIHLKSLLVAEARGNYPVSRYSTNQIASFQPRDTKLAVRSEFLSTLTKVEMATKLQQSHGILFDKSVERMPLYSFFFFFFFSIDYILLQ